MTASSFAARLPAFLIACALALPPLSAAAQEVAAPETEEGAAVTPEAVTAAEAPANAEDYVAAVVTQIRRVRINTAPLREAGVSGKLSTLVTFTTGADGRLVSSAVSESSGNPVYDNIAMATIRSAEPFPLFAPDMGAADRSFSINIATVIEEPQPDEAPTDAPVEPPAE